MRCEILDHRLCCIVDEAYVSIPYMYYHTFVFILQVPKATDGQVRDTHQSTESSADK